MDKDLLHRPFDVSCFVYCGGKESLLASAVVGLGGVLADGCLQFSPNSMMHRDSRFCKHGASCLEMSLAFLPCGYPRKDAFTFVVLPNSPEFEEFCAGEFVTNTLEETSLSSVVN